MMIIGNLLVGIMPKQLLPVILTFAFATSCTQDFLWQEAPSEAFAEYRASFEAAAGSKFVGSIARPQLLARLAKSHLLWLGDHHRHSRLHALQNELLTQLQEAGIPMAFGLEAIGVRDQHFVNDYLAGTMDMATLRSQMRRRWSGSWLDDRDLDPWFFRTLLEFAKQHRIPVFALEPTPRLPLALRDPYISQSVLDACRRYPTRLIVTVVGQTHLVGNGNVVGRTGVRATVIGGQPTTQLRTQSIDQAARGTLWRADSGVLWFQEMLR